MFSTLNRNVRGEMKKSVNILLRNKKGKYVLQLRDGKKGICHPLMWNFFGGKINDDESPVEAAKREIFEEIGGFDEAIRAGEDTKLANTIARSHEVWTLADCAVIHLGYPRTLLSFYRRQHWHSSSFIT